MEKKSKQSKNQSKKVDELKLNQDELNALVPDEDGDEDGLDGLHINIGAATICGLLTRPEFYWRNHTQLTPGLVEDKCQRAMIEIILKSYRKYGSPPDPFLLKAALAKSIDADSEDGTDPDQFLEDEIKAILDLKPIVQDDRQLAIIQNQVSEACREGAYTMAFHDAKNLLSQGDYEGAFRILDRAKQVGPVEDSSIDFFSDPHGLIDLLKTDHEDVCAVTGFETLDKAKQGGFRKGELIVIVGKPGKGKSAILCHVAVANLIADKKVLFITLENSRATVVKRVIASLMKVSMNEILESAKYLSFRLNELKKRINGGLRIEEAPGGSVGVEELRGLIERAKRGGNFDPDVVILDYLGEMKPEKQSNRYEWLETRAQEIRALGSEFGCAMVTAAQTNRQAESTSIVTAMELGDCYGIFRKADMFITLNADEQERLRGLMRLYVDKNRQGKTGFIVWIKANFETMQFEEIDKERYDELAMTPLCEFTFEEDEEGKKADIKDSKESPVISKSPVPGEGRNNGKKKNPFLNRYSKSEIARIKSIAESGGTWEDAAREIETHSPTSVRLKWEKLGLGLGARAAA